MEHTHHGMEFGVKTHDLAGELGSSLIYLVFFFFSFHSL